MLCLPWSRIALKMTTLLAHNPIVSVRALQGADIVEEFSSSEYAIDHRLSRFRWIPRKTDLLDDRLLAMLLETSKGLIYETLVSGQPLTVGCKITFQGVLELTN